MPSPDTTNLTFDLEMCSVSFSMRVPSHSDFYGAELMHSNLNYDRGQAKAQRERV